MSIPGFATKRYDKGTALAEIARQLGVTAAETFAAGDHLNDLPMLSRQHAHWLAAPGNAIEIVKATVRRQNGHVSALPQGHGVAEGLQTFLTAVRSDLSFAVIYLSTPLRRHQSINSSPVRLG